MLEKVVSKGTNSGHLGVVYITLADLIDSSNIIRNGGNPDVGVGKMQNYRKAVSDFEGLRHSRRIREKYWEILGAIKSALSLVEGYFEKNEGVDFFTALFRHYQSRRTDSIAADLF